jgi:hypothetical protein
MDAPWSRRGSIRWKSRALRFRRHRSPFCWIRLTFGSRCVPLSASRSPSLVYPLRFRAAGSSWSVPPCLLGPLRALPEAVCSEGAPLTLRVDPSWLKRPTVRPPLRSVVVLRPLMSDYEMESDLEMESMFGFDCLGRDRFSPGLGSPIARHPRHELPHAPGGATLGAGG